MAEKLLPEKKVLKQLGIQDFRHLTKEKVIKLASMLDSMDPEVAKKALEQFPNFAKTTIEALQDYKSTLEKGLLSNDDSVKAFYAACTSNIEALQEQLKKDELTFEEKKYIIEQLNDITRQMSEKDSENKKFIFAIGSLAGVAFIGAMGMLVSALGTNVSMALPESEDEKEEID